MCTLTFSPEGPTRHVFFNRDELLTRSTALPPKLFTTKNGEYLMPVDPDSGGSWMGLHNSGFFICLLNNYPGDRIIAGPQFRSRGLLIRDILDGGRIPRRSTVEQMTDTNSYAPFFLGVFSVDSTAVYEWDGEQLAETDISGGVLSTSGFQHSRISRIRSSLFQGINRKDPQALAAFHRIQNIEAPEEGILMLRNDASTVSISHVVIGGEGQGLSYAQPPDFKPGDFIPLPISP